MTPRPGGTPRSCRACGKSDLTIFYEARGLPSQTCLLFDDRSGAESHPTGDVELAFCGTCGFIQNVAFEASLVDYSQPTEESQAFSGRFQDFASNLAESLVHRHNLIGRSVLEVGCGKGDFLFLLADLGIGKGLGIDPGFLPNRDEADAASLSFIKDFYDGSMTDLTGDLVLSRHLMEHVPNVKEFLGWLSTSTRNTPDATLFTEVPDVLRVLREGAFWDVYYEHCSYFTLGSLGRTLEKTGLSVTDLRMGFENQYLLAEAAVEPSRVTAIPDDIEEIAKAVDFFAGTAKEQVAHWRDRIGAVQEKGDAVAVWGGGSKAVAFLSTLGLPPPTVVDINPHKQGKWLPGTAVEVSQPEALAKLEPRLVVAMNPIYLQEIARDLRAMGLAPELVSL